MTIEVKCDRCKSGVKIREPIKLFGRGGGDNQGYYFHALFTLLGKDRNYTLCEKCEALFITWLNHKGGDQPKPD